MDEPKTASWLTALGYAAAIALNLVWIWRSLPPEKVEELRDEFAKLHHRLANYVTTAERFERLKNETIIDAEVTLKMAAQKRDDDGPSDG